MVDLRPLVEAIDGGGLEPHGKWRGKNGVVAWMFEYDLLREMGAVHTEFTL